MVRLDESALICDFAETYHILDWRALPLKTAAVLASGLRENSRIKMKMARIKITPEQALLAATVDRLSMLVWFETEDGHKGRKRPESILARLTNEKQVERDFKVFETAEDFETARQRILQGGG